MNASLKGILVAGSLATLLGFAPPSSALAAARAPAKVTVTNTRNVPVVVYLDREPLDVRLGMVAARSEATLDLPPDVPNEGPVRIVIDPEGGPELCTPDLEVKPGRTIMVEVPIDNAGFVPYEPAEVIPNPGPNAATLTVQNSRSDELTIYLERGDFDIRLGTVLPKEEKTFRIPARTLREGGIEEIVVHPEHGIDLANQNVEMKPGDHVLVRIPTR